MILYRDELDDLKELDVNEMFRYLVKIGADIKDIESHEQTLENKVPGCVSQVYIIVESENNKFSMRASSEAMVVKGFLAIIYKFCSELTHEEFQKFGKDILQEFFEAVDLNIVLSPSRANGFGNAVKRIFEESAKLV